MNNNPYLLLKSSVNDLKRNLLRSFLTVLGILIGISSVVLLLAFGLGLKSYINNQFEGLGSNIIIILPGRVFQNGNFQPGQNIGGVQFDARDYQDLSKIDNIQYLAPGFMKSVTVTSLGKSQLGQLYGTTEDIFPMRNLTLKLGKYFTKGDVMKKSKKAVIGPKIAEVIFGSKEIALFKKITIEKLNFDIIGILDAKGGGGFGGPDFDSFIYVPYTSVQSLNTDKKFYTFTAKALNSADLKTLKSQIGQLLEKRYESGDFSIVEQTEIQNTVSAIFSVINIVLVAIGGISLLVGGIGIMNIMFVTVVERYQEIGIRRALGATRKNILNQFLLEAVLLSLTGGISGLIFSALIIVFIRPYFPAYLDFYAVSVSLLVSISIGVIFGVLPAKSASIKSPVEAIRYE